MNRDISDLEKRESLADQAQQFALEARTLIRQVFDSREKQRRLIHILDQLQIEIQDLSRRDQPVVAVVPLNRELEKILNQFLLDRELASARRRFAFDPKRQQAATSAGVPCAENLPDAPGPYEVYLHPPLNETGHLDHAARLADALLLLIPQSDFRHRLVHQALQDFCQGKATVVVLMEEEQEVEQDVKKYRSLWQAEVPEMELKVRWSWMPGLFPHKKDHAQATIREGLVELVSVPGWGEREGKIEQCLHRAAKNLQAELEETDSRIRSHTQKLHNLYLSGHVARVVREEVLPPERTLQAMVRQQLMARLVTDTPLICFPYRDLAGLLSLLFGVWTRLWSMATGSITAWLRGAWQAGRNISQLFKYLTQWSEAAVQRCEQRLQQELGYLVRDMARVLMAEESPGEESSGEESSYSAPSQGRSFEVQGVDRAVQMSFQVVQEQIANVAPPKWLVWGAAFATTAVFVFLIAGPLLLVYQKYLAANWNWLAYGDPRGWNELPVFDWKYVFSILFYATAPVFLGAMIALSLAARKKKVNQAVHQIMEEHKKLTERIRPFVRARVSQPRVQAYLDLRRLIDQHAG